MLAYGIAILVLCMVPHREMNSGSCGPRALYAVTSRLGNTKTEAEILELFPRQGYAISLGEMGAALPKLGLRAASRNMSIEQVQNEHPLGVLHVDDTHFVALVGYEKDAAIIVDSLYRGEERPVRWLWNDLASRWDGAILVISRH